MQIIAGKPYKVTLRQGGKTRVRWQVKFWTRDPDNGDKVVPLTQKTFGTRTEAIDNTPGLLKRLSGTRGRIVKGDRMRFKDLVGLAETSFYGRASIRQGRKTLGVRSYAPKQSELKLLSEYFGDRKLTNIAESDLYAYREWRLENGSRRGKKKADITLSTVNRELSTLRRMLNYALGQGWLERNPFAGASGIIDTGAEVERTRVLSKEEEAVLLALCEPGIKDVPTKRKRKDGSTVTIPVKTGNPELTAAVVFALDCGLRRGEILKLRWQDVSIENATATVIATHTKTQKARQVGLSDRLIEALTQLPSYKKFPDVFATGDLKRSWNTVRKLAGLGDLRFHDLRGTAASRLISQGVPLATVGKYLGHENHGTTLKFYVRSEDSTIDDVRQKMNDYNNAGTVVRLRAAADDFLN